MICIINKPTYPRPGRKQGPIFCIDSQSYLYYWWPKCAIHSPFVCITHRYHHHRYQKAQIKGWSALRPVADSIKKHNFDIPWLARIGLFVYTSRLGSLPKFQATRLKFQRSRSLCPLSFPQVRPSQGPKSVASEGANTQLPPGFGPPLSLCTGRAMPSSSCAKSSCYSKGLWWNPTKITFQSL